MHATCKLNAKKTQSEDAMYAIKAGHTVLSTHVARDGYVLIDNGTFAGFTHDKPLDMQIVDYSTKWVAPGYVDVHILSLIHI